MKTTNKKISILIITAALLMSGCSFISNLQSKYESPIPSQTQEIPFEEGAKVPLSEIQQGCFGMDCIPSIDSPKFETAAEANSWLNPEEIVFALNYQNTKRAYPQKILNQHEIVNDFLEDNTPVAITFCPLCGSALAFERKVNGQTSEFGVSGKLHNSDLIMYDRNEENYWQQITGEAIVGPAARRNEKLKEIPLISTTWEKWSSKHPDTEVLSQDTGFPGRNYDYYPYGSYEEDSQLYFRVGNIDNSIPIKTPIYGIEIPAQNPEHPPLAKAYTIEALERDLQFTDQLGPHKLQINYAPDGTLTITNTETSQTLVPTRLFWFAWAAFHPETELYQ